MTDPKLRLKGPSKLQIDGKEAHQRGDLWPHLDVKIKGQGNIKWQGNIKGQSNKVSSWNNLIFDTKPTAGGATSQITLQLLV